VLFYVNNLYLIPTFLVRRMRGLYVACYAGLSAAVAAAYLSVLKLVLIYIPTLHVGSVSPLVAGGETAAFTFGAFIGEWFEYFMWLFFAGCIFAMSWYVTDYPRQQRIIEETRKKQLEMELALLKSQVNPHFLFNTLNNLYALTVKKSDNAPEVVSRLSVILRYMLYESDTALVSFEREKEIMQAYIDLELLRLPNIAGMQFHMSADKEYQVPPLLWLPVLENVFKHGTRFISDLYFIEYRATIKEHILHIHSCNTFKQERDTQNDGLGLRNLEQRLKLLFGTNFVLNRAIEGDRYITDIRTDLRCLQTY